MSVFMSVSDCKCNRCPFYRFSDEWQVYYCKKRNVWLEGGPYAAPNELPPAPIMGRFLKRKRELDKLMKELGSKGKD